MKEKIALSSSQQERIKKKLEAAVNAYAEYEAEYRKLREELGIGKEDFKPILGFLYYKDPFEPEEKCRLAYITDYMFNDSAHDGRRVPPRGIWLKDIKSRPLRFDACFSSVRVNGAIGTRIETAFMESIIGFEPFDGTVEEARRILREANKAGKLKFKK